MTCIAQQCDDAVFAHEMTGADGDEVTFAARHHVFDLDDPSFVTLSNEHFVHFRHFAHAGVKKFSHEIFITSQPRIKVSLELVRRVFNLI